MLVLATNQMILFLGKSRHNRSVGVRGRKCIYLEELELERERWRLRPGDLERERLRTGERLLGERDLQEHEEKTAVDSKQEESADITHRISEMFIVRQCHKFTFSSCAAGCDAT